jgi:hypothetical protein
MVALDVAGGVEKILRNAWTLLLRSWRGYA